MSQGLESLSKSKYLKKEKINHYHAIVIITFLRYPKQLPSFTLAAEVDSDQNAIADEVDTTPPNKHTTKRFPRPKQ